MMAEIIIFIIAFLFLVLSIFLFNGKGSWLIAGYNTASEEERKKFDLKKLCKAAGVICLVCAVMLCFLAYMGYRADKGLMDEFMMLPVGLVFSVVIITTVIIAVRYMNTKAKK